MIFGPKDMSTTRHGGDKVGKTNEASLTADLSDATLITRGEKVPSRYIIGVGFIVHPTVVHLVEDSITSLAIFSSSSPSQNHQSSTVNLQRQQLMTRN
ncbi:unnamed protein product [Strongylus vulgaris]|uniref:Uncharacterized protein n=1 Tax=Strongylus vulgaris TaxID=40348 RepID=A0A3P7I895_STRVU|nr:unnamed protein product [Strongylus vulgaris]